MSGDAHVRFCESLLDFPCRTGLRLSPEKTKITNINTGLDFLGANVRKVKGKFLIKPFRRNVVGFDRSIREFIQRARSISTAEFIRALNRKVRGWAHVFRHQMLTSATFSSVRSSS